MPHLGDVLTDPDAEVADICLSPHLHFHARVDALETGKKINCGNPLVTSLCEADALAGIMDETEWFISPVFLCRFGKATSHLKAMVDGGRAGRVFAGSLEAHRERPTSYNCDDFRGIFAGKGG